MLMTRFATTASTGFSRLGVSRHHFGRRPLVPRPAQQNGRCGEGVTAMATAYQDNVPSQVQPTPDAATGPVIRNIGLSDLRQALRAGWEDFQAVPSHAIILCVIYPILGLV